MNKVNGGIENVVLWSYCVSNEPFVGCYIEKENVKSSPLETRGHLVLALGTRANLVLAFKMLQ